MDVTGTSKSIVATTDGHIIVSPVTGRQLKNTADAFGHPEWIDEGKTMKDHTVLMRDAVRKFESATSTMTSAEALDRLREHDVPAAPVLDLDAHLDDPQVRHNALYETVEDPHLGTVRAVRYPSTVKDVQRNEPRAVPTTRRRSRSTALPEKVPVGRPLAILASVT